MKEAIKEKWIEALRSGEYTQARNSLYRLHADDRSRSYCCLGVLCDLYRKEHPDQASWNGRSFLIQTDEGAHHEEAVLPFAVQQWAGLPDDNPELAEWDERDEDDYISPEASLAELNDGRDGLVQRSFEEIANLIHHHL